MSTLRVTYVGDNPALVGKTGTFDTDNVPVVAAPDGRFTPDGSDQGYDCYYDEVIVDGERCPRGGDFEACDDEDFYNPDFAQYVEDLLREGPDDCEDLGGTLPSDLF